MNAERVTGRGGVGQFWQMGNPASKEDKLMGHSVLALPQSGMAHNGNSFTYLLKVHGHILICQPKRLPGSSGKMNNSKPMFSAPAFPSPRHPLSSALPFLPFPTSFHLPTPTHLCNFECEKSCCVPSTSPRECFHFKFLMRTSVFSW